MTINEFKKINDSLQRIEKLEKEINSIEEIIKIVVTEGSELSLKISVEKKVEEENKPVLDTDGSLIDYDIRSISSYDHFRSMSPMGIMDGYGNPKNELSIEEKTDVNLSVIMLETLLRYKREEKSYLMKSIQKLGVKI